MLHLSAPVEVGIFIVLLAAIMFLSRKGKENFPACIAIMTALTFLFVAQGSWVAAAIYALLTGAWVWAFVKYRRKAKAKAERERRENESVANSAGEPDNLPY